MIHWKVKKFDEMQAKEIYDIWNLREAVFVVEQKCIFLDADGKDREAYHVMGYEGEKLIAYARIMYPEKAEDAVHFGRVCTHQEHRGSGIGKALLRRIKGHIESMPCHSGRVEIAAQSYLVRFYQNSGFVPTSESYIADDGIAHTNMRAVITPKLNQADLAEIGRTLFRKAMLFGELSEPDYLSKTYQWSQ